MSEPHVLLRSALCKLFGLVSEAAINSGRSIDLELFKIDDYIAKDNIAELIEKCCEDLSVEMKSLEERFSLLSNNLAAALMIEDESGNVVYYSPFSEILTGYTLEELPTTRLELFSKLVVDEDLEKLLRACEVAKLGEDIKLEYRIRHSTGMHFWWESHFVPIYDSDGTVQGLMWVSYDVSHYVYSRRALQERNQDLNDFTYMVSHDLKAPIYTIEGMTSALVADYGQMLGDDGKELLSYISKAATQMNLLVSSVVEYSKLSNPRIMDEEVQLDELLQDVIRDLAGMIKDKNACIEIGENLPLILGERLRIYQVFSNLIGNALKYSSDVRNPLIKVAVLDNQLQDWSIVTVEDNGIGIPEASRQKIFRPFQRAHSTLTEGSGIGLACVDKIVKQLGGTVKVESEVGVGSTFTVFFPTEHRRRQELVYQKGSFI